MGHDITASKVTEIKYLRRNMWSKTISKLYDALGCIGANGGVSGYGYDKLISKEEIMEAIHKIKSLEGQIPDEDIDDYLDFLNECSKEDEVLISFY